VVEAVKPFRVILADPPWRFGDRLPGPKRGASKHYRTMATRDICALHLPPIAKDAIIFLWRVSAMQEEAFEVMKAWRFQLKSELVWIKTASAGSRENGKMGMGHYTRLDHEVCLIGTRGRGAQLVTDHGVRSVVFAPRGEHSAKPGAAYDAIERLTAGAEPRLELFARKPRLGWECWGDEVGVEIPFGLLGGCYGEHKRK
jgi:N6-adenosine-specific RNA methylase IME4